jgi:hypothetical protein
LTEQERQTLQRWARLAADRLEALVDAPRR